MKEKLRKGKTFKEPLGPQFGNPFIQFDEDALPEPEGNFQSIHHRFVYRVRQNACPSRALRPMHKTKICHKVTISVVKY